jgi:hypothetical protein
MIKPLMSAWAGLLDATQFVPVLNGGKQAVYRYLAEQIQNYAEANLPPYQTAITLCDTGASIAGLTTCREYALDVLQQLVRDAARAIGLDKIIEHVLNAWNALPAELRTLLDVRTYNQVSEILDRLSTTALPKALEVGKYVANYIGDRADEILEVLGPLKALSPSAFSAWARSMADGAVDYGTEVARKALVRTTGVPTDKMSIVLGPSGSLLLKVGTDIYDTLADIDPQDVIDFVDDNIVAPVTDAADAVADAAETVYEEVVAKPVGWVIDLF